MSLNVYNDENADPAFRGKANARPTRGVLGDVTNNVSRPTHHLSKPQNSRPGYSASTLGSNINTNNTNNTNVTNINNNNSNNMVGKAVAGGPVFGGYSAARDVQDIDFGDELDPQMCSEYVEDIFSALLANEDRYQPSDSYMAHQPDINEKMRTILFDWLVDVHIKFKLLPETLYLTFNYADRFLERKAVSRQRLQLVGVTCLLIASKYEEIYAPEVRDCVYITDKAYNRQEIYRMERHILATLGFHMTAPNIGSYMKRFVKAAGGDSRFRMLATYFAELTLQEYRMLRFKPSMIVASAISLALKAQRKRSWSPTLEHYTRYSESSLQQCVFEMTQIAKKAATATQYTAVRNKFSSHKYLEVAKTPVADL